MTAATDDATARLLLMQRMIALSRDMVRERDDAAALRRDALGRAGLDGVQDDLATLVIPAQREPLVAVTTERKRWLRRHLVKVLRAYAETRPADAPAPVVHAEPSVLGRSACALCQGVCCGYGGDRAYLTKETMARVRRVIQPCRPAAYCGATWNPCHARRCRVPAFITARRAARWTVRCALMLAIATIVRPCVGPFARSPCEARGTCWSWRWKMACCAVPAW